MSQDASRIRLGSFIPIYIERYLKSRDLRAISYAVERTAFVGRLNESGAAKEKGKG